jgi:hypothetical protein
MQSTSVLSERELLQRVQQRIDEGRLPVILPSLISAGYGAGTAPCAVCDLDILADQVIYEIDDPRRVEELLPFHFACYVVWQRECAHRLNNRG